MSKYSQEDIEKIISAIERFKGGDKDAFNEFYALTYVQVFKTCAGLMKNEHDAEDITQEVFIRAYEKLDSLSEPATFGQWLKVISTRTCLNELKKKEHTTVSFDETFSESEDEDWAAFDQLPNTFIEEEEKREIINRVLRDSLNDDQYHAMRLFYYEDMSLADIADLADCPVNTVKSRLKEARKKFKDSLDKYVDENKLVLSATPFLTRFFLAQETKLKVPPMPPFTFPGIGAGTAATAGTAGAATAAAAKVGFMSTVLGKVIVGVGAVAVIGTAVVVGVNLFADKHEEPVETTEESAIVETETTTEETTTEETTTTTTAAPIEIDPFEYIEVTFEGIAPDGEVIVNVSDDVPVELNVVADPSGSLNNGDTVTITVSCDDEGYTLVNSSQEFTVSGLERIVEVYQADTYDSYKVPVISISGLDMSEINASMCAYVEQFDPGPVDDWEDDDTSVYGSGDYTAYIGDGYVSIMLYVYNIPEMACKPVVYNISTQTGELLDIDEFLMLIGMSADDYNSLVAETVNAAMDDAPERFETTFPIDNDWNSDPSSWVALRDTNNSAERLESTIPYVSDNGNLCFVCTFNCWNYQTTVLFDTVTHQHFSCNSWEYFIDY